MKTLPLGQSPFVAACTLFGVAVGTLVSANNASGQAPMRRSVDVPPVVVYRPSEPAITYYSTPAPTSAPVYRESTTTYYYPGQSTSAVPSGTMSTSDDVERAVTFYPPLTTGVTAAPPEYSYRPIVPTTATTTYVPVVAAPAAATAPSTVTSYQPVTAYQPIISYPSVTTYQPVTTYSPLTTLQPATAYQPMAPAAGVPIASAPVAAVPVGPPVVLRTKAYVPGQPLRNFVKAITP